MGLTQRDVTSLLGFADGSMISRYENGISLPPLEASLALEIILRTPVAFLFPQLYERLKSRIRAQEEHVAGRGQQSLF